MHKISNLSLDEFIKISEKEGITYKTRAEAEESASNLVQFVDLLIEMDMQQKALKNRLKDEPKGFSMAGEGRNCSLCGHGIYEGDGWYDKWGFKCLNCQDAVNKKKIPGSLCGDYDHKKCITDSALSYRFDLHVQTIRKLIRRGDIKARQIPNGPYLILKKDNPNLKVILQKEKQHQEAKNSQRAPRS